MRSRANLSDLFVDADLFVGGRWISASGPEVVSRYPADGSVNRRIHLASVADANDAIAAAHEAFVSGDWATLLPHERARVLYAISEGIVDNLERFAHIQTRDTGKTLSETRALTRSAAATFRYYAGLLESSDDDLTVPRGDYLSLSCYRPLGVIGAITPWNSPIASEAQKVAPALAAGNSVVLKPATWAPLTALEFARVAKESGLPDGLLSVIPGNGYDVGSRLVEHELVKKVSFTGGTAAGRKVAEMAARKLMPVSLELGGKSPVAVFNDADRDAAIAGILYGIFSSTGQSCIAGSRLYVQQSIYRGFTEDLIEATRHLRIGDPTDPRTQVGPLITEEHRESVEKYVRLATEEGGRILVGGSRPDSPELRDGSYFQPTIIGDVSPDATVCREEIFGPVLVVLPFEDEDDFVHLANDSPYGLACGIWTHDYRRAWRISGRIDAGVAWVNTYKQFSISAPFGGTKHSGVGREKGRDGIRNYMRQQSVFMSLSESPLPWAGSAAANRESSEV